MDAALFKIAVKRRLRMRVQEEDICCPMCGGTMDSYGDHALVCPCRGDRTVRHNRLRDIVYEDARKGNLNAEREKAGLLPGRPQEDDMPNGNPTPGSRSKRRPADV